MEIFWLLTLINTKQYNNNQEVRIFLVKPKPSKLQCLGSRYLLYLSEKYVHVSVFE